MFDRDMRYLFASSRWISDYRLATTREQLRGRSPYEVFPEIPQHWKDVHQRGLCGEVVCGDAEAFVRSDAAVDWDDEPADKRTGCQLAGRSRAGTSVRVEDTPSDWRSAPGTP
jgi:hypothetical protein